MPETPECDRVVAVADESHAIGDFLDWLTAPTGEGGRGIVLAHYVTEYTEICDHDWHTPDMSFHQRKLEAVDACPACQSTDRASRGDVTVDSGEPQLWPARVGGFNTLLADYFKIDLDKVEAERRAILDAIRAEP